MKRTLVALVEDKPGTLNRVASLFRRRAFNIESLTVGHTERPGISRMTIVVDGEPRDSHRVQQHLDKLIHVLLVQDVTDEAAVLHDLALIKVCTSDGTRSEVMRIADTFGARILDIGLQTLMVEATAPEDHIDRLVRVLQPFGIEEMVRTGRIAMVREPSTPYSKEETEWPA
jgi:acetolactate synthase I/III small subunit